MIGENEKKSKKRGVTGGIRFVSRAFYARFAAFRGVSRRFALVSRAYQGRFMTVTVLTASRQKARVAA
jgi:hypothetical protein